MRKRILEYRGRIDRLLLSEGEDWETVRREHLVQISFFQHERLVHLIVTVTFALLLMAAVLLSVLSFSMPVFLLAIAILILLIPYIRHYYLLENEVQKMYAQYDLLCAKTDGKEGMG